MAYTKKIPPYCQGILDFLNELQTGNNSEINSLLLQAQTLIDQEGHTEFYFEYGDEESFTLALR